MSGLQFLIWGPCVQASLTDHPEGGSWTEVICSWFVKAFFSLWGTLLALLPPSIRNILLPWAEVGIRNFLVENNSQLWSTCRNTFVVTLHLCMLLILYLVSSLEGVSAWTLHDIMTWVSYVPKITSCEVVIIDFSTVPIT